MTKTRQWAIFTAIAVLIVFVAGWMLAIKPQKSKAADLTSQVGTEQSQAASLQQQISQLEDEQRNLPQEQESLQKFATQVPDNPSEPTLLRQIYAAANGSGVELVSVTPGTTAPVSNTSSTGATTLQPSPGGAASSAATGLTELPVSLGIAGTYPNLEMFFQSLEQLPRSLMVTNWSMCPIGGNGSSNGGGTSAPTGNGSGGATCTAPTLPQAQGTTPPTGELGGTLSTLVYFSGSAAATASGAAGTTAAPATGSTSAATPAASPSATTSTATS